MAGQQPDNPSPPPRWLAPMAMTLGAWLVAWLTVTALLTLFGDELGSLPLAVRALVISGVLVGLMVNLVMPVLSSVIARLAAPRPRPRLPGRGLRSTPGDHSRA